MQRVVVLLLRLFLVCVAFGSVRTQGGHIKCTQLQIEVHACSASNWWAYLLSSGNAQNKLYTLRTVHKTCRMTAQQVTPTPSLVT